MAKILNFKGVIVPSNYKWIYDLFGMECVCPADVTQIINEARKDNDSVIIKVNSRGGSVEAGSEIYEEIKTSDVYIESRIVGDCCSAATYVACAANKASISPLGQYMVHRSSCGGVSGNCNDLQVAAQMLSETDEGIANAYVIKTGKNREEILEMMNNTTFMSAQNALKNGFVDEILFDENGIVSNIIANSSQSILSAFNSDGVFMIPDEMLNELMKNKDLLLTDQHECVDFLNFEKEKALAKLNLMKLGGRKYE